MKTLLEERKDYLNKLIDYLSNYFGVQSTLILISKAEEYVGVRYILIQFLCSKYSDREVAQITDLTKSGVNSIKNKFKDKESLHELYKSLYSILNNL